jgi:hypothetical protein
LLKAGNDGALSLRGNHGTPGVLLLLLWVINLREPMHNFGKTFVSKIGSKLILKN